MAAVPTQAVPTPATIATRAMGMEGAKYKCTRPLRIMGIQEDSPLAWSTDGNRLAFVSESNSIFIAVLQQGRFVIEHTMVGHTKAVYYLLFHPSDPVVVSCGKEGIFVWDYLQGICIRHMGTAATPDSHEGPVHVLEWMYGGSALVSGSQDTNLKIWDYQDNFRCLETFYGHKAAILTLEFCRARDMLASAGRDSQIKMWDVSTLDPSWREKRKDDSSIRCTEIKSMDGHRGDVCSMEFSKDGLMLFSGARDNEIKVWDVDGGNDIRTLSGHKGDIRNLVLMNDEQLLLSGSNDSTVKLWELAKVDKLPSQMLAFALDDDEPIGALSAGLSLDTEIPTETQDGPSASAMDLLGDGGGITDMLLGNVQDKCILTLPAHEDTIFAMEVNKALPFMATSSGSNCVRIWNISDLIKPTLVSEFIGHAQCITAVNMLHDDAHILSASMDYSIFFYDVNTIQRLAAFNFLGSCTTMTVNPAQTIIFVGGTHYEVKAFSLEQNVPEMYQQVASFQGHSGRVEAIAVSPNNTIMVTGGHDFDVLVWPLKARFELNDGKPVVVRPLQRLDAHCGHVTQLEFSEDGAHLASSGTDHLITVWRVDNQKLKESKRIEKAHAAVVTSIIWGRMDSKSILATSSWDMEVKIWDGINNTTEPVKVLTDHSAKVTDVSVSKDGKYLISCASDCTIRVTALVSPYDCIAVYETPMAEGPFMCVDGGLFSFVSGSENGMLRIWPLPCDKHMAYFQEQANFQPGRPAGAGTDSAVDIGEDA